MKKALFLTILVCSVASLAFAQEAATQAANLSPAATATSEITLKGDIIDNMCASSQSPEKLADFVKTHTKECALMPNCVASGYSIYADGVLTKFDKDSNAKIEEFLKKSDSKLQVVVVAKKVNGELSLVSIANQQ